MKTTLNQIREHRPCSGGWEKLLKHLGKTKADDEELSILTILDSNGLDDALWCLRAVEGHDIEKRSFAVFCAKQVEHLLTDERSRNAIAVAERWCDGQATDDELDAAYAAANAAAHSAAYSAARAAANSAAHFAARAAADAAYAAAHFAAYSAARAAANAAANAAARSEQEAELRRICESIK
ncbi:MAG: hypothetical protein B7X60_01300 [Polynucleobacter sp. 39-45-136]|nr:MAG: hypothetical protein B7X60_01300 [Polynucleobacter sp. 39-45-136]